MKRIKEKGDLILLLVSLAAVLVFAVLYWKSLVPIEEPETVKGSALSNWDVSQSAMNGAPLREDKGIYEDNVNIYDVYISVFPTKNEEGKMIDFSAFDLHSARDHSYNPILNCNVQILPEGGKPDPLLDLDSKNATIQVRGNSARGDLYKSYRVKLSDEAGTFFGQKSLNINKHCTDLSKISSKISGDLLADIPDITGYRTYFMRLWIRDTSVPEGEQKFEYYGLFTEMEQPNKTYLETHGLSSNAVMYKARNFSFAMQDAFRNVDDPLYSEVEFDQYLGIREGNDHHKLLEMLEAVNDTTRNFDEIFAEYFNEDNYLTWIAFNLLIGNEDILNHNYLLYSPENAKTWYFIPWDFDEGFNWYAEWYHKNDPEKQLENVRSISLSGFQKLAMNTLCRRYFRMEGSVEKLDTKMQELLDNYMTRERVEELIDSYKPVLEKTMMLMPDLNLLMCKPDELIPYVDDIYDGILRNYEKFTLSSKYPLSGFVSDPVRLADGSIKFTWDPFYSLQGLPVTYSVCVYADFDMENLLYEAAGLPETEYVLKEGLPGGTYYVMVTGTDSEGYEQLSLEHVEGHRVDGDFYYMDGLREFTLG